TPDLTRKRMKSFVKSKKMAIKRLATRGKYKDLEKKSVTQQYIALAESNIAPTIDVFPDIPEAQSLCAVKRLIDWYEAQPSF
ncbi:MAG: hypothetical protein JSV74_03540, partial [Dehalococcoidia bacterium]